MKEDRVSSRNSWTEPGNYGWSGNHRPPVGVESEANRVPGLHSPIVLDSSREGVYLCVEFSTYAVLIDAIGIAGSGIHRTTEHHPICRMRLAAICRRIGRDRSRWVL